MHLVLVPEWVKDRYPKSVTKVLLPPDGDMTNPDIRSAEVLLDTVPLSDGSYAPVHRAYFQPSKEDISLLNHGGLLEFHVLSFSVTPFGLGIVHPEVP